MRCWRFTILLQFLKTIMSSISHIAALQNPPPQSHPLSPTSRSTIPLLTVPKTSLIYPIHIHFTCHYLIYTLLTYVPYISYHIMPYIPLFISYSRTLSNPLCTTRDDLYTRFYPLLLLTFPPHQLPLSAFAFDFSITSTHHQSPYLAPATGNTCPSLPIIAHSATVAPVVLVKLLT